MSSTADRLDDSAAMRVQKIKADIEACKASMSASLLYRGDQIDTLVDTTTCLDDHAHQFYKSSKLLKRKMRMKRLALLSSILLPGGSAIPRLVDAAASAGKGRRFFTHANQGPGPNPRKVMYVI